MSACIYGVIIAIFLKKHAATVAVDSGCGFEVFLCFGRSLSLSGKTQMSTSLFWNLAPRSFFLLRLVTILKPDSVTVSHHICADLRDNSGLSKHESNFGSFGDHF